MRWLGPYRGAFFCVLAVGLLLRLPGLSGDLGLDEILSLKNALARGSAWDVLVSPESGGSHHLVSLWLRALGPLAPSFWYRLPSLAAGVGTICVAAWAARREGAIASIVTASLFALAYPLVYYASEAQGYALAAFFALSAWYGLREYVDAGSSPHLIAFWIACGLGVLSHVSFIGLFLAAFVWCAIHSRRCRQSWTAAARVTAYAFLVPGLFIAAFYWIALRGTTIPIGPARTADVVIAETLSLLLGGPAQGAGMWAVGAAVAALAAGSMLAMMKRGDDRWLLYVTSGLAIPLLLHTMRPDGSLYPRDLLVPGALVLLALGDIVGRWMQGGTALRAAGALVLALACAATIVQVMELGSLGRGHFERAVRRVAEWPDGPWSVSGRGDFPLHDERAAALLEYYGRRIPQADRIVYVSEASYPVGGVAWIVTEDVQDFHEPADEVLTDFFGHQFLLEGEYLSPPLAGISWRLYRRLGR